MMVNEVGNSEWNGEGIISMRGVALRPITTTTTHAPSQHRSFRRRLSHVRTHSGSTCCTFSRPSLISQASRPILIICGANWACPEAFVTGLAQAQRLQYDCFSTSIIRIYSTWRTCIKAESLMITLDKTCSLLVKYKHLKFCYGYGHTEILISFEI